MDRNYWQEYWDNYYKFMAMYVRELQNAYPGEDFTDEYIEVAKIFEPSMDFDQYESYEDYFVDNDEYYDYPDDGYHKPTPKISPGGGQFTIDNCKKMAIVRIEMKKGYKPSKFYMLVDKYDKRSIQGYRIDCDDDRIKFKAISLEYYDISLIECVF